MNSKVYALIAVALIVMFSGAWISAPEYKKDSIRGVFDSSSERACFNEVKKRLNDPETAYLIKNQYLRDSNKKSRPNVYNEKKVQIEVRAKNGFGAYIQERFECVSADGVVRYK